MYAAPLLGSSDRLITMVSLFIPLAVPENAVKLFDAHQVNGATLLRLTDDYLQSMGIAIQKDRDLLLSAVKQLNG
jgi:hypothetical protein